jgi:hypothetical protein
MPAEPRAPAAPERRGDGRRAVLLLATLIAFQPPSVGLHLLSVPSIAVGLGLGAGAATR